MTALRQPEQQEANALVCSFMATIGKKLLEHRCVIQIDTNGQRTKIRLDTHPPLHSARQRLWDGTLTSDNISIWLGREPAKWTETMDWDQYSKGR